MQLAQALPGVGIDCTILTTSSEDGPPTSVPQTDVITLPAVGGRFRVPWRGSGQLAAAVRASDLVLLMNHWTTLNALAYRAARRFHKPHVVCPGGALPLFGRSGTIKTIYNAVIGRRLVASAAAHLAITRDEVEHFVVYGVSRDRIVVAPNAVPDPGHPGDPLAFRQRHGLGTAPILLFLGRLAPIKGPDLLLDAFFGQLASLRDWHLVFAGPDDGMLAALEDRVRRSGVSGRVHFAGFLGGADKQDALAAADLLVIPSRREAMSIVVLEAAAVGRPVLITDQCGVPEVAEVGGGWIVPASVAGLERGLMEAASDPAGRRHRGELWQRFATRQFSWPRIAALHREVFERVLREAASERRSVA